MPPNRRHPLPLLVITAVLTAIAVAAIASILSARSDYEDDLVRAYEVEAGGARMLAAGLAEEAALRGTGRRAAQSRRQAAADFASEARKVEAVAAGDAESERLVARRVEAQRRARAAARAGPTLEREGKLTIAALEARDASRELTDRQRLRRARAHDEAIDDTRAYLLVAVGAAVVSLAVALLAGRRRAAS
jgi:hypothetical protein